MQKIIFFFLSFFSFSLFAQNGPVNPPNTRSNGVANASVAFNDINSLFNNQAGLADLENISFLLSGQETFAAPFSTPSDNIGLGFAIPISSGTIGLNFQYFAVSEIQQNKIGLSYARRLFESLSIGIQFDVIGTQIPMNKKSNLFTFEIGLQYEIIENLLLGIHLYNPSKLEIIEDEFLPRILRVGTTYNPYEKLLVHVEIEKDIDLPFVFKSGIEYELGDDLWLRIGYQNNPRTYNFGIGYLYKKRFRFDLAAYYQRGLNLISSGPMGSRGLVPSIGLGYDLLKK